MTSTPVIIGAGLAGLVTALRCAQHQLPVVVLCAGELGSGAASGWAQGGIAAALDSQDSPARHAADTLAAGAGLCDPEVVDRITQAAPDAVDYLTGLGARFDRHPGGALRLGLEGAHSSHRIVHARGDGTGAEIMRAVVSAVRSTELITVMERARAHRLVVRDGILAGVLVQTAGSLIRLSTDSVVLATGGMGSLWAQTTNPRGSQGAGLALAARAGAQLRDLEMVQFHPTALDVGQDPMPLVSEAVRGAGASLVDGTGQPLTGDPLASRDVVARAVWEAARHGQVYLDATHAIGASFARRFPGVAAAAVTAGLDPGTDLIPVRPAAHYQCGGVSVDRSGRTRVPGLWAVGEVACTGLHGGNRLASNSLLEAVVCAGWVASDLAHGGARDVAYGGASDLAHGGARDVAYGGAPEVAPARPNPASMVVPLGRAMPSGPAAGARALSLSELRAGMSRAVGLVRTGAGLEAFEQTLRASIDPDPEAATDAMLVALLVTHSARRRRESRGGHLRLDYPHPAAAATHLTTTLADALADRADLVGPAHPVHPADPAGPADLADPTSATAGPTAPVLQGAIR